MGDFTGAGRRAEATIKLPKVRVIMTLNQFIHMEEVDQVELKKENETFHRNDLSAARIMDVKKFKVENSALGTESLKAILVEKK